MSIICTQQFKAGGYFVLSGGTYQAIWPESGKEVNVFMRGSRVTTIPKKEFQKYFTEWKGQIIIGRNCDTDNAREGYG